MAGRGDTRTEAAQAAALAETLTPGAAGGPISAPRVAALEATWAAIRERHPEIPAAVIVLGAGSIARPAAG
jgi:hypothetical protein